MTRNVRATLTTPVVGSVGAMDEQALARFLRARRAVVDPLVVGLAGAPGDSRRRVPGLRREELATLAGVSSDYYVRLEQGRGHRPSDSVLRALAAALQLDDELTQHLFSLTRAEVTPPSARETVSSHVQHLIDAWPMTPATVTSRRMNVLAANALARELAPCYEPGTNLLRSLFLDPGTHVTHLDWDRAASETVANFRARVDILGDDPETTQLVGELSLRSQRFRELWARHDVHTTETGVKGFRHPEVGDITLHLHAMPIDGDQVLTVLHAEPGSADHQALALLGTLLAGA
jgi:transcriptional regulator with XRE-family HTH domain